MGESKEIETRVLENGKWEASVVGGTPGVVKHGKTELEAYTILHMTLGRKGYKVHSFSEKYKLSDIIEVTECGEECPFFSVNSDEAYCFHPLNEREIEIEDLVREATLELFEECPLKVHSFILERTIKLKEDV